MVPAVNRPYSLTLYEADTSLQWTIRQVLVASILDSTKGARDDAMVKALVQCDAGTNAGVDAIFG